jgi:hypothetical protein
VSAGKPIVASDVPALRAAAAECAGCSVVWVRPDDPESLAAGIREALDQAGSSPARLGRGAEIRAGAGLAESPPETSCSTFPLTDRIARDLDDSSLRQPARRVPRRCGRLRFLGITHGWPRNYVPDTTWSGRH